MKKNALLLLILGLLLACKKDDIPPQPSAVTPLVQKNDYQLGESYVFNPDGSHLRWIDGKKVYQFVWLHEGHLGPGMRLLSQNLSTLISCEAFYENNSQVFVINLSPLQSTVIVGKTNVGELYFFVPSATILNPYLIARYTKNTD